MLGGGYPSTSSVALLSRPSHRGCFSCSISGVLSFTYMDTIYGVWHGVISFRAPTILRGVFHAPLQPGAAPKDGLSIGGLPSPSGAGPAKCLQTRGCDLGGLVRVIVLVNMFTQCLSTHQPHHRASNHKRYPEIEWSPKPLSKVLRISSTRPKDTHYSTNNVCASNNGFDLPWIIPTYFDAVHEREMKAS